VTGTKSAVEKDVRSALARIRKKTQLPIAVGFGIRTPEDAAAIAKFADAAVVGSAIVTHVAEAKKLGKAQDAIVKDTLEFCRSLAGAVRRGRANA